MRRLFPVAVGTFVLAVLIPVGRIVVWAQRSPSPQWITAWASSQHALGTGAISNATVRLIARVTIPGEAVRLRFDNTFGTAPVVIGSAYVGHRVQGPALRPGSNHRVMFNQASRVTIPTGGSVVSDPIALNVLAGQDLAVSLYLPENDVRPSQHTLAFVTSYLTASGAGDVAADETRTPFTSTTTSMLWLKAIDVLTSTHTGAIVTFGDSITDGNCSTIDAQNRWEDWLAVRIDLENDRQRGVRKAVVNEGISGNTIGRDNLRPAPDSPPGLERLDRDVLSHHGVTDVVLFMGTNDIRREASADQVMSGMQEIAKRVKARGLKLVGVTVIPRHNNTTNSPWDGAKTATRNRVNQWIRTKAPFDGVLDFDMVVRDPANPDLIYGPFNCDDIHPTPRGYYEMGRSVPLDVFRR
jgi:lysophospholipase L1-like esterase